MINAGYGGVSITPITMGILYNISIYLERFPHTIKVIKSNLEFFDPAGYPCNHAITASQKTAGLK